MESLLLLFFMVIVGVMALFGGCACLVGCAILLLSAPFTKDELKRDKQLRTSAVLAIIGVGVLSILSIAFNSFFGS